MALGGNSGALGYKPQANSLMQPQPSPIMGGVMVSEGGRINQKTLQQLQQMQKEQQQKEQEQKEIMNLQQQAQEQVQMAAMAMNRNQYPKDMSKEQAPLASGFAQSLYGVSNNDSNMQNNNQFNNQQSNPLLSKLIPFLIIKKTNPLPAASRVYPA